MAGWRVLLIAGDGDGDVGGIVVGMNFVDAESGLIVLEVLKYLFMRRWTSLLIRVRCHV